MLKLMSNDKVDKVKLHNDEDKNGKDKNRYSNEEVDRYTICKTCLIRKSIHFDITLLMMKYHQPVFKSLNKLRLFKK